MLIAQKLEHARAYQNADHLTLDETTRQPTSSLMDSGRNEEEPTYGSQQLSRPSEYLRSCCPLCFGGENWHDPKSM